MSDLVYYVYCIADGAAAGDLPADSLPAAIEDSAHLEWVAVDELAALVSQVPRSDYSEESLAEHLVDATWTAIRAMRHETVVEYVAKRTSVIPLRFGTIYLERVSVEHLLSEKGSELAAIIKHLRGREEWGVNVYSERTALLANVTSLSPVLIDLVKRAEQAPPGQSYLMLKKIEALRVDEARSVLNQIVNQIEERLGEKSDEGRRLRILKVETTEHGELKAKFAFLIQQSCFEEFRNAAELLAQQHQAAGFRLELTGPWPAYNFVTR